MDKASIRKEFRHLIAKTSAVDHSHWSEKLTVQLQQFLASRSGLWGFYNPLPGEPQINALARLPASIQWCYPRVAVGGKSMGFYKFLGEAKWQEGSIKGLKEPEPKSSEFVETARLQGCLVPGLAFDRKGYRLGRGKGYYDQALAEFKGLKVGVLFSLQIYGPGLPAESHDVCMDYLITENELIIPVK